MNALNLFCMGTAILSGLIYGINCIVTKKAGTRSGMAEGKAAVVIGWQLIIISGVAAICFIAGLITTFSRR